MRFIFVAVIVIVAIVVLIKKAKKRTSKASSHSRFSESEASRSSPPESIDTLEKQDVYACLARYIGAISALREHCTWRSSAQGGCIQVTRTEDGRYNVGGHYDHDSNYDVLLTLQRGGYLDYFGMKYVDDGFSYHVEGIDPGKQGYCADNKSMLITDQYIVSSLHKRFGASINITDVRTSEDSTCIFFDFPE